MLSFSAEQIVERRKAISEAFHSLYQPLTGLHCGLEIGLLKDRTGEEYRKRLSEALANAGTLIELNRALRELVDAADPGERFGTVSLGPLLAQLRIEIQVIAEARNIGITIEEVKDVEVAADPIKLLRTLGNLLSQVIYQSPEGGMVSLGVRLQGPALLMEITGASNGEAETLESTESKIREMRWEAARCYLWAIGGSLTSSGEGLEISIPRN